MSFETTPGINFHRAISSAEAQAGTVDVDSRPDILPDDYEMPADYKENAVRRLLEEDLPDGRRRLTLDQLSLGLFKGILPPGQTDVFKASLDRLNSLRILRLHIQEKKKGPSEMYVYVGDKQRAESFVDFPGTLEEWINDNFDIPDDFIDRIIELITSDPHKAGNIRFSKIISTIFPDIQPTARKLEEIKSRITESGLLIYKKVTKNRGHAMVELLNTREDLDKAQSEASEVGTEEMELEEPTKEQSPLIIPDNLVDIVLSLLEGRESISFSELRAVIWPGAEPTPADKYELRKRLIDASESLVYRKGNKQARIERAVPRSVIEAGARDSATSLNGSDQSTRPRLPRGAIRPFIKVGTSKEPIKPRKESKPQPRYAESGFPERVVIQSDQEPKDGQVGFRGEIWEIEREDRGTLHLTSSNGKKVQIDETNPQLKYPQP